MQQHASITARTHQITKRVDHPTKFWLTRAIGTGYNPEVMARELPLLIADIAGIALALLGALELYAVFAALLST